jgi:hypothetical protein
MHIEKDFSIPFMDVPDEAAVKENLVDEFRRFLLGVDVSSGGLLSQTFFYKTDKKVLGILEFDNEGYVK